jgi:hypothetical protein
MRDTKVFIDFFSNIQIWNKTMVTISIVEYFSHLCIVENHSQWLGQEQESGENNENTYGRDKGKADLYPLPPKRACLEFPSHKETQRRHKLLSIPYIVVYFPSVASFSLFGLY